MLPYRWILREADAESLRRVNACEATRGQSALVRRLLAQRGHTEPDRIERFLRPRLKELSDPFLLPNMDRAVERIFQAIDRQESVVLYGDYDVDGVTSLTLLKTVLAAYGLHANTFLPHRLDEGYGVSRDGLERCLAESQPQLLIAVDCGTSSAEQIAWLKEEHGVECIIFDHHECPPDRLPECVALVNPKLGEAFHYLCSAGVIFKLAHALIKTRPVPDFDLKDHLDIVALGTVADIVPLIDENRLLVRKGLEVLEVTRKTGLRALKEVSALSTPLTSMDLGFRLGPRLNASGRLDTAQASLDLLLSRDALESQRLAQLLDRHNRDRQQLEHRIQLEAHEEAEKLIKRCDPAGLVIGASDWHPGVVGIVASRLVKKFHRPIFVVAIDENGIGKGSGRSVEGISLVEAINENRDLLINGGGHEMAAGLTIAEENLEEFQERFALSIARQIIDGQVEPTLYLDAETRLSELTLDFLSSYDLLQPFGSHNPQPLFLARSIQPAAEPRTLKEKHIRFEFYQDGVTRIGVWFNGVRELGEHPLPRPPWDIAFYVDRNSYRGQTSIQLLIQGLRSASPVQKQITLPQVALATE